MKQAHLLAAVAAASIALAGCKAQVGKDAATDTAAVEQALKGIEGQWQADYNARDAKRTAVICAGCGHRNRARPLASERRSRRGDRRHGRRPNMQIPSTATGSGARSAHR